MNTKNLLRQEEERRILEEIEVRFQKDPSAFQGDFLVVSGKKWHRGVLGIVASRLVDRFHRPVLVLSFDGEFGQGSGRSIAGFDLLKAMDHCRHFFMHYGGHSQAAGCTLDPSFSQIKKLNKLGQSFQEYASAKLSPEQLIPSLRIESILRPKEISLNLCRDIEKLAPFGVGNPLPVLASEKIELVGEPKVLKSEHLKLRIQCNGSQVDAIWWRRGEFADRIKGVSQVDLAYTVSKDQYRGKEKLLLSIRDLRSELESN